MNIYFLSCKHYKEKILLKFSEVTLKINGTGNIKLFSDYFFQNYQDFEIYLNDTVSDIKKNEYFIDSNTNCSNFTNSTIYTNYTNCS